MFLTLPVEKTKCQTSQIEYSFFEEYFLNKYPIEKTFARKLQN